MGKNTEFELLMPLIANDLIKTIADKKDIDILTATRRLYFSKLYKLLEVEETKVWHFSTPLLFSLFEQEEKAGVLNFPSCT